MSGFSGFRLYVGIFVSGLRQRWFQDETVEVLSVQKTSAFRGFAFKFPPTVVIWLPLFDGVSLPWLMLFFFV